jgi:hypothetical protein
MVPPAGARPPVAAAPAPAARPAPGSAPAPRPAPAAAAPAPAPARRDPFGFGLGGPPKAAPAPAAAPREEDFGDIDIDSPGLQARTAAPAVTPAAPAPAVAAPQPAFDDVAVDIDSEPAPAAPRPAAIELPDEVLGAGVPDLAPMHAFVPPPDKVGHKPEVPPAAAAAPDGGEALLREALSQASRDVIERVVWEVVPQLAETIIRENLDRLVKQRQP